MLEIRINLKSILYFALGIAILYALMKAYNKIDTKVENTKKLIPDKDVPYQLSANIQGQVDSLVFTKWQQVNLGGGGVPLSNIPFAKTFTNVISVSILASEHLKAHVSSIMVLNTAGDAIIHNYNITGQDIIITFDIAKSGTIYVS